MSLGTSPADPWKWKWSNGVGKSEMSIIWCISITNNVKPCKKINETAQTKNCWGIQGMPYESWRPAVSENVVFFMVSSFKPELLLLKSGQISRRERGRRKRKEKEERERGKRNPPKKNTTFSGHSEVRWSIFLSKKKILLGLIFGRKPWFHQFLPHLSTTTPIPLAIHRWKAMDLRFDLAPSYRDLKHHRSRQNF